MISQIRLNKQAINLKLPEKHIDRISCAANLNAKVDAAVPKQLRLWQRSIHKVSGFKLGSVKTASTYVSTVKSIRYVLSI